MRQWAQAGGGWHLGLELALCFLQLGEGSSMVKHAEDHVRKEWVVIYLLACMHACIEIWVTTTKILKNGSVFFFFFPGFSGHAWHTCGHAECRHSTWTAAVASFFIVLQSTFLVWIWSCGIHSVSCICMTVSMSIGCRGCEIEKLRKDWQVCGRWWKPMVDACSWSLLPCCCCLGLPFP